MFLIDDSESETWVVLTPLATRRYTDGTSVTRHIRWDPSEVLSVL